MNKSKVILIFYLTFFLFGKTTYAQKVSNITFHQEQSTIIVSYDLDTKTTCKVSLYVSTNGGVKWQGPLSKVTGDIGNKILSGNNSITWNVLEEFEELRGDKIMFQVRAVGDNIETVIIGTQEWTTKNLNVSKYRNGDIIPEVKDPEKWKNMKIGAWCYYNNDPKNGAIYGKLYNWYAFIDSRGLAPEGYHLPSYEEYTKLVEFLGGEDVAGGKLKQKGILLWKSPNNYGATYDFGFAGIPGGERRVNHLNTGVINSSDPCNWKDCVRFEDIGRRGCFWVYSKYDLDSDWAPFFLLRHDENKIFRYHSDSNSGLSVRCIKD